VVDVCAPHGKEQGPALNRGNGDGLDLGGRVLAVCRNGLLDLQADLRNTALRGSACFLGMARLITVHGGTGD
jgi:hypothetical protein